MPIDDLIQNACRVTRWYGNSVRENYPQFLPSLLVSSVVAAGGQEVVGLMDAPPEWLVQAGGYTGATISGYSVFLGLEYRNKKEHYPRGFLSREMGKTIIDIASADYLADLMCYTPVFVGVNHVLLNSDVGEFWSGLAAAGTASLAYFLVICGVYDRTQALTSKVNGYIRSAAKKIGNIVGSGNGGPAGTGS